jgi:hypothetical protein
MCMADDTICYGCKKPLQNAHWDAPTKGGHGKPPISQRVAMIFACLGAAIVPVAMGHESYGDGESIDFTAAHWAGVGGAIGGTLGLAVGSVFERKKT